jgi:hypothetical protein
MRLHEEEVMTLQDVTGNASLSLKHIHSIIEQEIDEKILLDAHAIGKDIVMIIEAILKSHKPFSYRSGHDKD